MSKRREPVAGLDEMTIHEQGTPRTIRVNGALWAAFLQAVRAQHEASAAHVLRRYMLTYIEESLID